MVQLDAAGKPRSVTAQALWWYAADATATIEQVAATPTVAQFKTDSHETMYRLRPEQRLWVRLELNRLEGVSHDWKLWIPLPLLDSVTLYEQRGTGKAGWQSQQAGDTIAVSQWPEFGRYPRFHLSLPEGKSVVYLQIRGSTPLSIPIWMANEPQAQLTDHVSYLGLGVVLGALLLLVALCFVQGYIYRDPLYATYGLYALLMVLAASAYTGLAAQFLWDNSPVWADAAQGSLAFFTAGAALFFINTVLAIKHYAPRWARVLQVLGGAGPVLAVLYLALSRNTGVAILSAYMFAVMVSGVYVSIAAWRRGDTVGRWVFWAYMPLAASVLLAVLRALGWVPISWIVQYGVVTAMLIEVPLLMVALNIRSRERHASQTREEAMATQDALTGLLVEPLFKDRLQQAVRRSRRNGEHAAVVLVSLVNHSQILATHGAAVAEQSLVRSVIKLRRVLRDVDTAARVGQSQFGLVIEGAKTRDEVTQVGARLIALGLMPLKGLQPEVTLQFQFAAAVLNEYVDEADQLQPRLHYILSHMSSRTRRPIRFLLPSTQVASPESVRTESTPDGVDLTIEVDSVLPDTVADPLPKTGN